MIYQLSTAFTLLNEKSGVLENQSTYAMLEYATASGGAIPPPNTGIRITPGGKFRFSLGDDTNAFVRFLYLRAGDYERKIAVVSNTGTGITQGAIDDITNAINNHHCHVDVHCCCCHCHGKPVEPDPPEGMRILMSGQEQPDKNIVWGDTRGISAPYSNTVNGDIKFNITNMDAGPVPPSDPSKVWIHTQ